MPPLIVVERGSLVFAFAVASALLACYIERCRETSPVGKDLHTPSTHLFTFSCPLATMSEGPDAPITLSYRHWTYTDVKEAGHSIEMSRKQVSQLYKGFKPPSKSSKRFYQNPETNQLAFWDEKKMWSVTTELSITK